jgi:hypothetical protein
VRKQQTRNLETGDTNYGYLVSILYLMGSLIENTHYIPKEEFCKEKKAKPTEQDRIARLRELNANKRNK